MGNEHIKTIAKGAGIFFVGLLISKIFSYFYRVIIARGMGPEVYGIFSLCFAIVSIVSAFTIFGLPNAIERYVPFHIKDKSKVKGIILFVLQVGIITSVSAMVLLYLAAPMLSIDFFKNSQLLEPLKIFLISIPAISILTIYEAIGRAFKKVEYTIYAHNIVYSIFNLVAAGLSVYLGFGIMGLSYGFLVSILAALVLIFILVEKTSFNLFDKIKTIFIRKEILSFSGPLVFAGMFSLIIGWTDTILIGYFMNELYVGLYNSAIPTVNLLLAVPIAAISMLVPTTAALLSSNKLKEIKESYVMSTEWVFFLNLPVFLIFVLFPQQILSVLFGAEYIQAAPALVLLSIGFFMLSLAQPALKMLELLNKTRFYMAITSIVAILNVVLNVILIPLRGIEGAAIASLVSMSIIFILSLTKITFFEKYKLQLRGFIGSGAIAGILVLIIYLASKTLFIVITPVMLIPLVILYLSLYTAMLYMLVLRDEEKDLIRALLQKLKLFSRL
jgi:O-antigen/teichoic acid export membrane protein